MLLERLFSEVLYYSGENEDVCLCVSRCCLVEVYRSFRVLAYFTVMAIALMKGAQSTPKILENVYETKGRNNPEDSHLQPQKRFHKSMVISYATSARKMAHDRPTLTSSSGT